MTIEEAGALFHTHTVAGATRKLQVLIDTALEAAMPYLSEEDIAAVEEQKKSKQGDDGDGGDGEVDWLQLLAIGLYEFGLTSEQFWKLTPAQFAALSKQFNLARQREDYGFGMVASVLANIHRDRKRRKQSSMV